MVRDLRSSHYFHISSSFFVYISVLLLTLPLRWMISLCFCAVFHELFHILSAKMMGISIKGIWITPCGARIYTQPMSAVQELICALAGPIGGLLPGLLLRTFPQMALIALLLTFYNLLPVYPADGARVLRCGLALFLRDELVQGICLWIERLVRCMILLLGLYGCLFLRLGIFPLGLSIALAMRGKMEKLLANGRERKYNIPTID